MIEVTDIAISKLIERNVANVRLGITGGGCAGYEYEWNFDNDQQSGDMLLKDIFNFFTNLDDLNLIIKFFYKFI